MVNKGSASISVIDSASLSVVETIVLDNASRPHGIVFSPVAAHAFVTLEATGDLLQLDAGLRTELGRVYLGPDPRHLSIVADGSLIYVSRFVTPRLPDEATASPIVELGGVYYGGEVLEIDVASLTVLKTIILRWSDDLVSESNGPGLPNYKLGQRGGITTNNLTVAQLAQHNHTATTTSQLKATTNSGNSNDPTGRVLANDGNDNIYTTVPPALIDMASEAIASTTQINMTGNGSSIENRDPYLVMRWCVALQGVYPSRN